MTWSGVRFNECMNEWASEVRLDGMGWHEMTWGWDEDEDEDEDEDKMNSGEMRGDEMKWYAMRWNIEMSEVAGRMNE